MVANFKKKKSYLFVILAVFVSGIEHSVSAQDVSNDTVVMRIVNKNGTHEIKPMAMINRHVFERKGKRNECKLKNGFCLIMERQRKFAYQILRSF